MGKLGNVSPVWSPGLWRDAPPPFCSSPQLTPPAAPHHTLSRSLRVWLVNRSRIQGENTAACRQVDSHGRLCSSAAAEAGNERKEGLTFVQTPKRALQRWRLNLDLLLLPQPSSNPGGEEPAKLLSAGPTCVPTFLPAFTLIWLQSSSR